MNGLTVRGFFILVTLELELNILIRRRRWKRLFHKETRVEEIYFGQGGELKE